MSNRAPFTTYTVVDGDYVAYQLTGSGPDLLFLPSMFGSHVDVRSGYDPNNAWYRELASCYRMICRVSRFRRL